MTHHESQTTTLIVKLNTSELCRAARLGGLPVALDDQLLDDPDLSIELVRFFAKRGITSAIHDSFDRLYPARYPEDIELSFWQMSDDATATFTNVWRGSVSW